MRNWLAPILAVLVAASGCTAPDAPDAPDARGSQERPPAWALVLHGGAGTPDRNMPDERREAYLGSLRAALERGRAMLEAGDSALDAVEQVIRLLEDDPQFNAGKGAVFSQAGRNELDASIMNGADLSCGAVTGVTTVKNPISLARLVMERTPHVLLAGAGAEAFADEVAVERVDPAYFFTQPRWDRLQDVLRQQRVEADLSTVGVAALDRRGDLAAGTSTGGLTAKRFGRVGDSPIVGAGTYADNATCAVSATGKGEEFIRRSVARSIAARMEFGGLTLQQAAEAAIHTDLRPGDGGVIAVDAAGGIAMVFNTAGMFRGAADASGRFEVAIWD